mgnify:CR=1 FL=1
MRASNLVRSIELPFGEDLESLFQPLIIEGGYSVIIRMLAMTRIASTVRISEAIPCIRVQPVVAMLEFAAAAAGTRVVPSGAGKAALRFCLLAVQEQCN